MIHIKYAPTEILLCSSEPRSFYFEFRAIIFHFVQYQIRPDRDSNSGHCRASLLHSESNVNTLPFERAAFLASELSGRETTYGFFCITFPWIWVMPDKKLIGFFKSPWSTKWWHLSVLPMIPQRVSKLRNIYFLKITYFSFWKDNPGQ